MLKSLRGFLEVLRLAHRKSMAGLEALSKTAMAETGRMRPQSTNLPSKEDVPMCHKEGTTGSASFAFGQ